MADDAPGAAPDWTLGAIRQYGMKLEAACKTQGCGAFVVFDLDSLIARFGADHLLPATGPGLACETCGGEMKFELAVWHSDHEQADE